MARKVDELMREVHLTQIYDLVSETDIFVQVPIHMLEVNWSSCDTKKIVNTCRVTHRVASLSIETMCYIQMFCSHKTEFNYNTLLNVSPALA